ncbi:MAG TPA: Holliday junction branch migration protein RuvA [Candidatus Margulisiibacteriota bacterium]|nr:Holliday junction branch migration protein RuvA [Candidatus Margulisiibacteriota bacterium]
MISKISGKVVEKGSNHVVLEVGGLCYEIMIPSTVMQRLQQNIGSDSRLTPITFHYLQIEQTKGLPVLIGFLNEVEKDFFEVFITVSGIGPRAALKALNKPISQIARAIDEADTVFLKSLPGIGEQRAREIIAKLQNKVGRFGLIQDSKSQEREEKKTDIVEESLAVLMQLEYKRQEALAMIKKALELTPGIQSTEELLNLVYKQKRPR